MRILGLLIVSCGWLAPVYADDYALIIGVNHCPEFRLPDGSKPRPLRGAESDAQAIAGLLKSKYDFSAERITQLTGDQANLKQIRTAFKTLSEQLQPTDRLVLYYSGHGTQLDDRKPFDEEDELDEALCLYDAKADGSNLLLDDELGRWLDDLPAGAVTILLDCCHAGTGHKELDDDIQPRFLPIAHRETASALKQAPWQDVRGSQKSIARRTAAFFACQANQQAYERRLPRGDKQVPAGQFTHFLIAGLETGAADLNTDGAVTQEEVQKYLAKQLDESFNARREDQVDQQQPALTATRPELNIFFIEVR
ncbi:MAG: caspase domain-containing protein [Planctomycetaceae bacterium]